MARYVTKVRTPWSIEDAFEYMADLRNFAEWDPGVTAAVQAEGDGGGPDTAFDVTVNGVGRGLTLRYVTVEHTPPRYVRVVAEDRFLTSDDRITVEADGDQTVVTYQADLTLNGVLGLADPLLRLAFRRIGDRAAAGLRKALEGVEAA